MVRVACGGGHGLQSLYTGKSIVVNIHLDLIWFL